jgi:hypothetical protein
LTPFEPPFNSNSTKCFSKPALCNTFGAITLYERRGNYGADAWR